jgi:hypothetical protein
MFEKAIELNLKYSDAYMALGWVQLLDTPSQWSRDPHSYEWAIQLGRKSIVLGNSNAITYALLSMCYTFEKQFDLGVFMEECAIAVEPNFALA